MSRFGNLELGDDSEDRLLPQELVKDEAFYFGEARLAFERGDFEVALRAFSKVLEFNPQNAAAWTGQVRALVELGEYREAKLWADKALEKFPHEPELLAAKAVALGRIGDLDAALAFSDAAIEERGDTPYIWLARGDVLLAREEKRANFCFDRALTMGARDWFIAWLAARIRYFYKQFALALKLAQQAVEWNPASAVVWLMQGLCQRELGLLGPARVSLAQSIQLDPGSREAATVLGALPQAGVGSALGGWWRRLFSR
jgi:tetratricopeptide (TPR) repeat protein